MLPCDERLAFGDIIEEGQWMKIWSRGNGLSIGLKYVFLGLEQTEIGADVIEDIVLFGLVFFKRLQTHNDYNIITKLTKKYNIMHFIDK